ncbi:MAG: selenium cofactor biosynthesis protein YqeC [Salinarchaeum sp.]
MTGSATSLPTTLAAESGIVCAVGAGGKKTTLYALADALDRAVVTATVRIPIFDDAVADVVVTDNPAAAVRATDDWPIGVVPEREREDRYRGYAPSTIATIDAVPSVQTTLVKADGARMRQLKAPNDHEPQLPAGADTVLVLASVHTVGEALTDECVHRPEQVATITGREYGDELTPVDVATVLASEQGGQKAIPADATAIAVLNMVDNDTDRAVAERIADAISESAFDRVVLARMQTPEIVAVRE